MGDDTTIQVPLGNATVDSKSSPRSEGDVSRYPAEASKRRELLMLPMELIHLNRTCTSVDLASAPAAQAAQPAEQVKLRSASDANFTDEEKVHRVRHQVSFAHEAAAGAGSAALQGADLVRALRNSPALRAALEDDSDHEPDEDDPYLDNHDDPYASLYPGPSNLRSLRSPDTEVDFLAVRPSLASTQLNEIRGPSGGS